MSSYAVAALLLAATAWLATSFGSFRLAIEYERARLSADDPAFAARLTAPGDGIAARIARFLTVPRTPAERKKRAAILLALAEHAAAVDQRRIRASAYYLAGHFDRAAATFPVDGHSTASEWNDLAAAATLAAMGSGNHDLWLAAIDANARALMLDPQSREARFNSALIVSELGVNAVAEREWRVFLVADPASPWAAVARRKLDSAAVTDTEAWRTAYTDRLTDRGLADLTRCFPQQARTYMEGIELAAWADAVSRHDAEAAARHRNRARTVATALEQWNGESLLARAVDAIDRGPASVLSAAHLAYREGRLLYRDGHHTAAERRLEEARKWFERGGSPMAVNAAFFAASAVYNQNRPAEALEALKQLLASQRAAAPKHQALTARILHEIALCEAVLGHWSASLAAAEEAVAIFHRLGERGNAAAAETILSEDYDFLGHPHLSWRHGLAALRKACDAGDHFRARVILAVLCRTELRGERWARARTVLSVERRIAAVAPDLRSDTDMHIRIAAVESRIGRAADVDRALRQARSLAARLPNNAARATWFADIDGVAGAITRSGNPRHAIALLTSAIAFQARAARPIILPELYLERGRAHAALGQLAEAEHDFDQGIRELERQRSRVHDADLRPGIFDDATDLFGEAISLQLRRNRSPLAVLAYVERGRARTMFEQMERAAPSTFSLTAVQRHLGQKTRLIEYVSLRDSLAVLIIAPHRMELRVLPVSRNSLEGSVSDLMEALSSQHPTVRVLRAVANLYDLLIRPIQADIADATAINIVVDDLLQRVPFAALLDRDSNEFLIERYAMAMAPSASIFATTAERMRRMPKGPPRNAVIFANPAIPRDEYPGLDSLAGSERESELVASNYPWRKVFLGGEATAARFTQLAPDHDVVHFAGHAVAREQERNDALVLAATTSMRGTLSLRQIAQMRFRSTRVVVLAACSTMTGGHAAVEGIPSVSRAFIVARVPAVVGTLWDIEDRDAAQVMRRLHAEIALGTDPASALRVAQIAALRSEHASQRDPRHWAAFSVMGACNSAAQTAASIPTALGR